MTSKLILRCLVVSLFFPALLVSVVSAAPTEQATCNPALAAVIPGGSTQMIECGGMTRTYRLYIPESYDLTQAAPLVLSLHGFSSNAEQQVVIQVGTKLLTRKILSLLIRRGLRVRHVGMPGRTS